MIVIVLGVHQMPRITFISKPELDSKILLFFAKESKKRGGISIFENMIRTYPEFKECLEFEEDERNKFVLK